ncbi:helix-turn-helix domain-containing protein [Streptomyces sp. NPDC050997]|uniref:ArsR/SmtB family transcription factor n=1 Tax=Streptomyces sp. NPDC050997 TaxID=3155519 RepID=UPI003413C0CD
MLRIHFTDADLASVRVASKPDPLWEVASTLYRFQSRRGLGAFADWHRAAREDLHRQGLAAAVRGLLMPLFPRGSYFPDFLTPAEADEGLDAGLDAIMSASGERVRAELSTLDRVAGVPADAARLVGTDGRRELVDMIRAYHATAVAPYGERMQAHVDADRSLRARALLEGGVDGLLTGFQPWMHWRRPILEVDYLADDRDLHLAGRGLLLVPSYFSWGGPVSLADPTLPPVLTYSLHHTTPDPVGRDARAAKAPLAALLGTTRAAILQAVATGATNGELARAVSVSAANVSHHTAVLRDSGLIASRRHANSVLHTLTPAGAALLRTSAKRQRTS